MMEESTTPHDTTGSTITDSKWVEYIDDEGNPYFFNIETQEYAWELPADGKISTDATRPTSAEELAAAKAALAGIPSKSGGNNENSSNDAAAAENQVVTDSNGVPWTKRVDESGTSYYENTETGETQWEITTKSVIEPIWDGNSQRLDPTVNASLVAARKANGSSQSEWVESYDPSTESFYYVSTTSGELRWEKPSSYIMAADDKLMTAVIKIQCAYRSTRARQIFFQKKKDFIPPSSSFSKWYVKTVADQSFYYNRLNGKVQTTKPDDFDGAEEDSTMNSLSKEINRAVQKAIDREGIISEGIEEQRHLEQTLRDEKDAGNDIWVEVYDPNLQQFYYYGSVSKTITTIKPPSYILAADDETIAAVITIQCAYRSRVARKKIASKRLSPETRLAIAERAAIQRQQNRGQNIVRRSVENEKRSESEERRSMLEEERLQCSRSDKFWGIDANDREIKRQAAEEAQLAAAEEFRRNLQAEAHRRRSLHKKRTAERKRRLEENDVVNQEQERLHMTANEASQCVIDRFWGLEKEEDDRRQNVTLMTIEDIYSKTYDRKLKEQILHQKWTLRSAAENRKTFKKMLAKERRMQRSYMKEFKAARSSDVVMNYNWPTRKKIALKKPKGKNLFKRQVVESTSVSGYNMDVVYNRGLVKPKNIFHMADKAHSNKVTNAKDGYNVESSKAFFKNANPKLVEKFNRAFVYQPLIANDNPAIEIIGKLSEKPLTKHHSLPALTNQEPEVLIPAEPTTSSTTSFERERNTLQKVFSMIDLDNSGVINVEEMTWALSRDRRIKDVASRSKVLGPVIPSSKQQDLVSLFSKMDSDNSKNVSWEEFEQYCKEVYHSWVQSNEERLQKVEKKQAEAKRLEEKQAASVKCVAQEEINARKVFELVDTDNSGTIDQSEMLLALENNEEVREFVQHSKALQPLLNNSMFNEAFVAISGEEDAGISIDEFVLFCTEVASIVVLNDL